MRMSCLTRLILCVTLAVTVVSCTETVKLDYTSIEATVVSFPEMNDNNLETEFPHDRFAIYVMAIAEIMEVEPYSIDNRKNPLIHPVTDITIVTIGDYNSDYPDGSVVNEAFGIAYRYDDYSPIPWPDKGDAPAYITHSDYMCPRVRFVVRVLPQPGEHQFCVNYTLSDGRVLSATTQKVTLL